MYNKFKTLCGKESDYVSDYGGWFIWEIAQDKSIFQYFRNAKTYNLKIHDVLECLRCGNMATYLSGEDIEELGSDNRISKNIYAVPRNIETDYLLTLLLPGGYEVFGVQVNIIPDHIYDLGKYIYRKIDNHKEICSKLAEMHLCWYLVIWTDNEFWKLFLSDTGGTKITGLYRFPVDPNSPPETGVKNLGSTSPPPSRPENGGSTNEDSTSP